jgi:aminoglycoside N3'-acetyltransferase
MSTPWSPEALTLHLGHLGVRRGDMLMVHVSLRRIGPTERGPSGLLDALDAAVGPSGTLLMVLGAVIEHEWVNQRPEEERAALLEHETPYDPLAAPCLPEVGYFAEVFRTSPGTIVNDNPSGRFAARGKRAEELFRDAPWDDYYGPGSPLHRLCQAGGRILRLGANPDTPTVLHYAEYLAAVPGARRVRRHYRVHGRDGPETRSVECLDDEHGIVSWPFEGTARVEWPDNDYFAVILKTYLAAGHGLHGRVGGADAELLEATDFAEFGARWMTANLSCGPAAASQPGRP